MAAGDLLQLAAQFGPMGLLVGYIIWDKSRIDTKWRAHEERRAKIDESRITADTGLALALQALTIAIQGKD